MSAVSTRSIFALLFVLVLLVGGFSGSRSYAQDQPRSNWQTESLIAWCIVPFDAKKRGPVERVEMLQRLGIQRAAYDWRDEHVSQFEDEIKAYKAGGIEFFAFWSWHDALEPLIKKHGIKPQIWYWCPSPEADTQAGKIEAAAAELMELVDKTRSLGLKLSLYNHGGWGGTPKNLAAVCEHLRENYDADHVGIVYNFHHGHEHVEGFADSFAAMKPYLFCLNLNGMIDPEDADITKLENKIRPIGSGQYESKMIEVVKQSGYSGPIGILDHRNDLDTEVALSRNIDGLQGLLAP